MSIQWVPKKTIDTDLVNSLLEKSIQTNSFTNYGPNVKLLEQRLNEYLKIDSTKAVICVANGTVAIWALVAAIELECNKKLQFATQSFTFPSSAQGYLDNTLIVDIDSEGGINLSEVPDTCDGIIVTNVFGRVVNIDKYEKWAKVNNKYLIFDNAATSYTFFEGKNSCNYGIGTTVSLHHTKPLGFGEGGVIIVDKKYEEYVRRIINFGIDNLSPTRKWHRFGSNYKMSDIQAVYNLQYLKNFNEIIEKHQTLYKYYIDQTINIPIKNYPTFSKANETFISCICFFTDKSDTIIKYLLENNIFARKYYYPLEEAQISSLFFKNIVCISFHVDLKVEDIDRIINIIKKVILG
jgi:dTDP-4-amino-4,6-dideoxygalactose transaminase